MMKKTVFLQAGVTDLVREPVVQNHFPRHDSGTVALFVLHALDVGFCCAFSLPPFSSKMVSECLS